MGLLSSKEKEEEDVNAKVAAWSGPYEDRVNILNETFTPSITEIILDYLNLLYVFESEPFDVQIGYLVGGSEPRLDVHLKTDPKTNCIRKKDGSISLKATVSCTQIYENYDEVEDYANPMEDPMLENEVCNVTIRCKDYPKLYTERHREFGQDPKKQRNGTKWTKEELGANVHCIEIELDESVRNKISKYADAKAKEYFKTLYVIPHNLMVDYWMKREDIARKREEQPNISWMDHRSLEAKGTWVNNKFFIFQNEGTKYTLKDEAEENRKKMEERNAFRKEMGLPPIFNY